MSNDLGLSSEFAKRASSEALKAVNWDILNKYHDTNIRDIIIDVITLIRKGQPYETRHTLNNGEEVDVETLEEYEKSYQALQLQLALETLEPFFFKCSSTRSLRTTLSGHENQNETAKLNGAIRNFPYKSCMLYFSIKYIHLETDPSKYNKFLDTLDAALHQNDITPQGYLETHDDVDEFVALWDDIKQATIQELGITDLKSTNDLN